MTKRFLLAAGAVALAAGAASAAPKRYDLPEPTVDLRAPRDPAHRAGFEAAQANCTACHAADYVATQPPGKGAAFWEAEVTKMVKVYRAPIAEADAKVIGAYLTDAY